MFETIIGIAFLALVPICYIIARICENNVYL